MAAPVTLDFTGDASALTKEIGEIKKQLAGLDTTSKTFNADYKRLMGQAALASKEFAASQKLVQAELKKNDEQVKKFAASFKGIGAGIGAGLVASLGGAALAIKSSANAMDELYKASQKIGVGVEELSGLKFAAEQSGVAFDALQSSMGKLNKNLADVSSGTSEAAKALRAIGVTGADSPQQALEKLATAFAAMPEGAKRSALAMEIFGKSGAEMLPMLLSGATGLKAMTDRARELGVVIDERTAKQAEAFNDRLGEMRTAMRGIVTKVSTGMLPALEGLATAFSQLARADNDLKDFGEGVGEAFKLIAIEGARLAGTIIALGKVMGAAAAASKEFFTFGGLGKTKTIWDELEADLKKNNAAFEKWKAAIEKPVVIGGGKVENSLADEAWVAQTEAALAALNTFNDGAKKTAKTVKEATRELTELEKALTALASGETERIGSLEAIEVFARNRSALEAAFGIEAVAAAYEKLLAVADPAAAALKKFADNINDAVNPANGIAVELSNLDKALAAGLINWTNYSEAVFRAMEKFDAKPLKEAKDTLDEIGVAIGATLANGLDGFVDALVDSEKSFRDWAASLLKELSKVLIKMALLGAIKRALGGTSVGSFFGVTANAKGNPFSGGTTLPKNAILTAPTPFQFASGGVFGSRVGIGGEAGPEAIVPLRRTSQGNLGVEGSPVTVNVKNNFANEANVTVESTNTPDGGRTIEIMIDRRVRAALSNGSLDPVMRNNYGLRRAAQG
jgi:hypothetical protein